MGVRFPGLRPGLTYLSPPGSGVPRPLAASQKALGIIKVALVVLFLSILPLAAYLFTDGRKMMKYERFPPPGMKVITDTKVVEGEKVKFQGQVVVVLSLVLILLGLLGALYSSYLIDQLANGVD